MSDPNSSSNPPPIPTSLSDLISILHTELDTQGIDSMDALNVQRIQTIMESYKSNKEDWEKYAFFDGGRYTRNLVDDGNGKFNLMVLCWAEGQASPIHDHSKAHCLLKVLDGELVETMYAWPEDADHPEETLTPCSPSYEGMQVTQKSLFFRDQVTYMHDKIGLHRVSNPQLTKKAVSLHLYCPPFDTCKTFCEETGTQRASGKVYEQQQQQGGEKWWSGGSLWTELYRGLQNYAEFAES
ncbi:Cysteine dioxygenase [Chytridiales sp. JEL 0842]|nr:Cysteine dioxygenase [Chytridiales sp. JEL 0842]